MMDEKYESPPLEINLQKIQSEDQDLVEIIKEVHWIETMIDKKQFNKEVITAN